MEGSPKPIVSECACQYCKEACSRRPGFFRRHQIEPLAAAHNMSVSEFARKHLQVDFFSSGKSKLYDVCMLVPRLKGYPGGSLIPADPRGVCHWLIQGRCTIHTLGKPAECAELTHVPGSLEDYVDMDRDAIAATWVGAQLWIEALLGRQFKAHNCFDFNLWESMSRPHSPDPDMFDAYA
jgi:hypothetical protein